MNATNKVISLRTLNTIDDEAAIWLVRLDNGKLSKQLKKELKTWLSTDKRHQVALKAMADTWDDMDEVLVNLDHENSPSKIALFPVLKPLLKPLSLAASFSFLAIFMWLSVPDNVHKSSFATTIGQQMDTTFADGSIVHLNTNSHIEAEFSDEKRIIKLIKGEALFEVAHDPDRPFIVYAGDRLVQAVGTKFVVHLQSENIEVTVTDGKVKMSKVATNTTLSDIKALDSSTIKKGDLFIAKGEQAIAESNQTPKLTPIKAENMKRELSWLNGKLIFENETLLDIIEEINRYSDISIVLKDPALNDLRISGRFDLGDSEALIEAIELAFNMKSEKLDANKVLLSKKVTF